MLYRLAEGDAALLQFVYQGNGFGARLLKFFGQFLNAQIFAGRVAVIFIDDQWLTQEDAQPMRSPTLDADDMHGSLAAEAGIFGIDHAPIDAIFVFVEFLQKVFIAFSFCGCFIEEVKNGAK